eukprot:Gb_21857 [translate_table: standard]
MDYTKVGKQLELELYEFIKGINSSTLVSFSSKNLYPINELQCKRLEKEKICHREWQFCNRLWWPLLSLAQAILGGYHGGNRYGISLESSLDGKVKGL